jgi:aromatic ring-opening dioxygenase catalytic subunit (LigB family)
MQTLQRRDNESLFKYEESAPGVKQALPTVEHFVPLLVAYGAAYDDGAGMLTGVENLPDATGTRRSLQFN